MREVSCRQMRYLVEKTAFKNSETNGDCVGPKGESRSPRFDDVENYLQTDLLKDKERRSDKNVEINYHHVDFMK